MNHRPLGAVLCAFLCACAVVASPSLATDNDPPAIAFEKGGGWHEALVGVSSLDETARFFTDVAGWVEVDRGAIDRASLAFFGLPADATGRYAVIRPTDYPRGWVRLIELEGVERQMIRPYAQAWDTGGVFSIMTRSADIERNLADAAALGWRAYNVPYDFGFGDLALRNIVLRGPDGVNVAIYEWVAPKREDAPPPGAISKAFNAMQMVRDVAAAKAFYVNRLGFSVLQEGAFLDPENRPTNFALPVNYATKIPRRYVILIPEGANPESGRVELMQFDGFEGRDLSARAGFANLGVVSLRFPVADIDAAYSEYAAENDAALVREIGDLALPPFGAARAFTLRAPDGAYLTFFELQDE